MASVDSKIGEIYRSSGLSGFDNGMVDTFQGINIQGRNGTVPINRENHGFTFFTRPVLNLSDGNIVVDRVMQGLSTGDEFSIPRAIRNILDYRTASVDNIVSRIVDRSNPFIPLLSNNLISLTGWRDYVNQTTSSQPGLYRETFTYVDDIPHDYEDWDATANFRSISGDPISYLFYIWGRYMALAREGSLMPYADFIKYRELDYNTRIYRILTDVTRRRVTRIGASGAGFPLNSPIGNIMNFTGDGSETPFQTASDQVSISFKNSGTIYYDSALVHDFNWLVKTWNRYMRDDYRAHNMVKLEPNEYAILNYLAYPLIDEGTMMLDWYVPIDKYNAYQELLAKQNSDFTLQESDVATGIEDLL